MEQDASALSQVVGQRSFGGADSSLRMRQEI
jgi:hypothetical protein